MEAPRARVLIVDDDPPSRRLLDVRLRAMNCQTAMAASGREALAAIKQEKPVLMLLDLEMPGMDGMELLRTLRQDGIDLPVIVITAHGSIEAAVQAMKQGAYDFIPKPFDPKHLEIVVCRALERQSLKREVEILAEEAGKRNQLVAGKNAIMAEAVDTARKVAVSRATVLLGESGTGKEIFARSIHHWSDRKANRFVAINCVGLSKELLESELFGHEKGAFTGADHLKQGKMELANGGTVFLDEIGDISTELQTKLLRFLQEREFERVGGITPIHVDVRIIAATNQNLEALVKQGRFREDVYHRLNVVSITLPPLRERKDDIPLLSHYFLRRFAGETSKNFTDISRQAMEKLVTYYWPGNIRELANVIERAVVLGREPRIDIGDLPRRMTVSESYGVRPENVSYREAMDASRRELVLGALARSQGNRATAAKALGLHEKYLLRLIKSLGIS